MGTTIIFATVSLIALGIFAIFNTVEKFDAEIRERDFHSRRQAEHTGMPHWR